MKTILGFTVASLLAGYAFGAAVPKPLEGMRGVVGVISAEGKADLPLAIAKDKKLVVHCVTAESADAIRNAADKAGLGGLVIAESLPVVALPYRDNLLNALVVEDWAVAQKQGLTQTEALRVVAPGGTICLDSGKGWELVTKKRPAGMVQNGTEGYASSHWTRLGDRRRSNSVVDGAQGVLLSWDPAGLASSERGHIRLMTRTSSGLKNAGSIAIPDAQVTGIAMDANHVVSSGGLYPKSGKSTGFVQVNGRAKSELLAKIEFPSPLSFHGIALDGGDIFITLKDGTLVCLGGTK